MTAGLFGGISRAFAWSGSGTSSDPYLINDRTDWDSFALQINSNNFNGKSIKLTADIDIGSYISPRSSEGFRGKFDD